MVYESETLKIGHSNESENHEIGTDKYFFRTS